MVVLSASMNLTFLVYTYNTVFVCYDIHFYTLYLRYLLEMHSDIFLDEITMSGICFNIIQTCGK